MNSPTRAPRSPGVAGSSAEHAPASPASPASASAFECNICMEEASEPVLTQCGHLFCWSCIYTWLQRSHRPSGYEGGCPVCKAEVCVDKVTPIYGRGRPQIDPRSPVPDRPAAQRPAARSRASPARRRLPPGQGDQASVGYSPQRRTGDALLPVMFGVQSVDEMQRGGEDALSEWQRLLLIVGSLIALLVLLLF